MQKTKIPTCLFTLLKYKCVCSVPLNPLSNLQLFDLQKETGCSQEEVIKKRDTEW